MTMWANFLIKLRNYINGEWVESKSGKTFDVEDPQLVKKSQPVLQVIPMTLTQQLKLQEKLLTLEYGLICQIMKKENYLENRE